MHKQKPLKKQTPVEGQELGAYTRFTQRPWGKIALAGAAVTLVGVYAAKRLISKRPTIVDNV